MTRVWFWARLALDLLGALMLVQVSFVLFFLLRTDRGHYDDHDESDSATVAATPAPESLITGMALGNPRQWRLVGSPAQQQCEPNQGDFFIRFRHRNHIGPTPGDKQHWLPVEQAGISTFMLKQLELSACGKAFSQALPPTGRSQLWLRLRDATWYNGVLNEWTLLLYDQEQASVYVWTNRLPY